MADSSMAAEIEAIVVDCYDDGEVMASWEITFQDNVKVPFEATLLGLPVTVTEFRANSSDVLLCRVTNGNKKRWIGVEDLDEEGIPDDMQRYLALFNAWNEGDY